MHGGIINTLQSILAVVSFIVAIAIMWIVGPPVNILILVIMILCVYIYYRQHREEIRSRREARRAAK